MITFIKDIKVLEEGGYIVGNVKSYSIKKAKNGKEYIEGIVEDKTGNIKFKIFNEKEVIKFKEIINETKNIKMHGFYQQQYKSFLVDYLEKATEEEFLEYIKKPEKDLTEIFDFYKNKKFDNNLFDYLYKRIVLENLEELKEYPLTMYKSFNYKGGLLERNYIMHQEIKSLYKNLNENLDLELLEIASLLKDIPSKIFGYEKKVEEYVPNDTGKLLSSEFVTMNTISFISTEFFDSLKKVIAELEVSKNNLMANFKKRKDELILKIEKLTEEKNKLLETYKFLENILNESINSGKVIKYDKDKLINILSEINKISIIKDLKLSYDKKNKEIKIIIQNDTETTSSYSLSELLEKIVETGKNLKQKIESINDEIETIELKAKEEYEKYENLKQKKIKEMEQYQLLNLKLLHILETAGYYFNEESNKFPKFPEAAIFANVNFSISNISFYIQEYKRLKENSQEGETIFSSKFGRYIF